MFEAWKENFKKLNKKYVWLWLIWIAAFGVIEFKAIQDKRSGDTLTEVVRAAIGTMGMRDWASWVIRIILAGGLIWAVPHFFTGAA